MQYCACRHGDACQQFDVVLEIQLPQDSSERAYFAGLTYSNWAMLALTA